jgi:hypothetical protein
MRRPVDREHDAVDTHLGNAARKSSVQEISACRQMEMLAEGFAERHSAADRARQEFVDAPKKKRQPLPEMAEYDHQPGILTDFREPRWQECACSSVGPKNKLFVMVTIPCLVPPRPP